MLPARRSLVLPAAAAWLGGLALAAACAPRAGEELAARPPKVVLVGIDGATFRVLQPLIDAGRAPELARLQRDGASGVLRSHRPTRSPALWTTVVTGRTRQEHGIVDFTVPLAGGGETLVSSRERRKPALWTLASALGRSVGFAGWWATWPAEEVDGWIVSDRFTRSRWSEYTAAPRGGALTHPPELAGELQELRVDPASPPRDEISRLADFAAAETAELLSAEKPISGHWLSVLKFAWCSQRSFENVTLELLDRGQPDLLGVMLIATDPVSHTFWQFYEPHRFPGVDAERAARLRDVIPNVYAHDDAFLARLRRRLDPGTVVLVVSDHGFRASGRLPRDVPAAEHAAAFAARQREALRDGTLAVGMPGGHELAGILLAAGGPVRAGVEVEATLFDIAPTVLALLGLPVPDDMTGRVLEEIIEPEFFARYPIRRVPSLDALARPARAEADDDVDAAGLEMLRSLGYIQ